MPLLLGESRDAYERQSFGGRLPNGVVSFRINSAIDDGDAVGRQAEFIAAVKNNRADLQEFLSGCDWVDTFWQSEANFILVRVKNATELVDWCAQQGIRIRDPNLCPIL